MENLNLLITDNENFEEDFKVALQRMSELIITNRINIKKAQNLEKKAKEWLDKNDIYFSEARKSGNYKKWAKHLGYTYKELNLGYNEWLNIAT
jgi:type II secretory pathway component PulK